MGDTKYEFNCASTKIKLDYHVVRDGRALPQVAAEPAVTGDRRVGRVRTVSGSADGITGSCRVAVKQGQTKHRNFERAMIDALILTHYPNFVGLWCGCLKKKDVDVVSML